jgi:hypothetical protein
MPAEQLKKRPSRPRRSPQSDEIDPQPVQPLRDDMYLTYAEAAAYARVNERRIERWVNETGVLPVIRLPQGSRIRGCDLREFMDERVER